MPAPALFVAGSIRATDPVSVSSQRAFPSVPRDCALRAATVAVGTMGVAGNGEGDGVGGNAENGMAVGDEVGLGDAVGPGTGATPKPPPSMPNARTATRSAAVAARANAVVPRARCGRPASLSHG